MKRDICFIFLAGLLVFSVEGQTNANTRDEFARRFLANYATTFYNMGVNNFPSDEANVALQTRDGYIWFGGYCGLIRYDGKQFRVWDAMTPNGFNSSNVRSLHEGRNGILWIGTNDKGLAAFRNGAFTIYDITMGLPSNTIRSITETSGGRIYGATPRGLFYISADGSVTNVTLDTAIHQFIVSIFSDSHDNVYAIFNSGELFVYTYDGRTIQYPYGSQIRTGSFVTGNRIVAGTQDGRVFITGFGVSETGGGETFFSPRVIQTPLINISSVYEDSNGHIWITAQNGIGFLDRDENYSNVGNPNGVGFYTGIFEDYQSGYWITGTQGGIVKFTLSAFTSLNTLFQLETGAVNAIIRDNGLTYIGTDSGLLIRDQGGRPILTDFSETIRSRVRGIFRDSRGFIWICTWAGAIRYTPETHEHRIWLPRDGLVSDRVRCMVELSNGVIVLGTATGVSFIRGNDVITANEAFNTDRPIRLPYITILSLVSIPDDNGAGTLYIGTDGNGIYAINSEGTRHFDELDGLTGGVILRMFVHNETKGILVSTSHGLCYIDENKNVHVIEKVPPHTFLDIMRYRDELVLLTSSNVIRTDAGALFNPLFPFEFTSSGRAAGLVSSINSNAWNMITEDGRLYICSENGVNIYSFEAGGASIIPFAGIARIDVDGTEHADFSGRIIMPRHTNRLTIDLSYLSFGFLDDARLHYILIGQDNEVQTLLKTDVLGFQVSYTNLRGGNYTLQVWTEDSFGARGNFIEVEFFKELMWFEYTYVWVIITLFTVLLIALLLAAIIRHKERKHFEKQREYRAIISQALSAIANAIDAKDSYTSGHSVRTAAYSVEIAQRMGMDKDFIENLYYIGLLHDVGKIGIPNEIINKPGQLSDEEYDAMKHHSNIGKDILKDITTIQNLTAGAAEHHERWDGSGYTRGITGENISLEGRIIAAADTYDAMSTNRSYRGGLPKEHILEEFKNSKGNQLDPKIAEIVIDMIEKDHFSKINVNKIIDIQDGSK